MSRGPDPALAPSKASRPALAARIYRVLGATLDPLYGLGGRPQLPPDPRAMPWGSCTVHRPAKWPQQGAYASSSDPGETRRGGSRQGL